MNVYEIKVIHKDWEGIICFSDNISNNNNYNKDCFRKDVPSEKGSIQIDENRCIIFWANWEPDVFFRFITDSTNSYNYIHQVLFDDLYDKYKIFYKNKWIISYLDNFSKQLIIFNEDALNEKTECFQIMNLEKFIYYIEPNNNSNNNSNNNIKLFFVLIENENIFYPCSKDSFFSNINISKNGINQKILLDTKNFNFILLDDFNSIKIGTFHFYMNQIILKYNDGKEEIYFSNLYSNEMPLIEKRNQIYFHIPKSIIIGHQVLFSNITLISSKIYCTSIHYKKNTIKPEDIQFFVEGISITNKIIYHHDHYESSLNIILELDSIPDKCFLEIFYGTKKWKVELNSFKIEDKTISAMTLFQNDYPLLKRWIKYYIEKGVKLFFLYYNAMCIPSIREEIENLLKPVLNANPQIEIHITQWNFKYWMNEGLPEKHHHAQTMAINDSLHILKNFSKYNLYNDLDEFFILPDNKTFNDLISENPLIDVFIFKNHFCKMGDKLLSYNDFDDNFDLSKVILGNYWDSQREKNFVRLENINVMGVHVVYNRFSIQNIISRCFGEFLHFLNFKEKDRDFLMYEYVV